MTTDSITIDDDAPRSSSCVACILEAEYPPPEWAMFAPHGNPHTCEKGDVKKDVE